MAKNVVVFGDSVTWGQGFHPEQKFAQQVASTLSAQLSMHAHSGATIGVNNTESGSCPPEAPRHTPTILQQVATNTDDPGRAELVIVNGGINDVSVQYILNPITPDDGLVSKVKQYCYNDMVILLNAVIARFEHPDTKIVVTSYFPIFSPKSDFRYVLQYLAHGLFLAPSPEFASRAEQEMFAIRSVELAMLFWRESRKQLQAAVNSIGSSRVRFADVPFTEDNSMFAPKAWLFNVHLEGGKLVAEDPLAESRKADCAICHANDPLPFQRMGCNIASAGHPNFAGADAFASAILSVAN